MNSQVCVNCRNKKAVNCTDNRLVREMCGHVKCTSCLVEESTGCGACRREPAEPAGSGPDDGALDAEGAPAELPAEEQAPDPQPRAAHMIKKKPETSHITIETDAAGGKQYVCGVCHKRFRARSQVTYHAYCNGQSKPYHCTLCPGDKRFASLSHYKYHMVVHRNERRFACDACPRAFYQLAKLRRHQIKHTPEARAHACGECGAAFANSWSLRKHRLLHSGERPHACPVCALRFRDSSNLSKHVKKKHAAGGGGGGAPCAACGRAACAGRCGARRHRCARCPRAFHSRKDLRRHAAVHSDARPFRCAVCARRFRRKDNLERHARNTHAAPPGPAASEPEPAPAPPPRDLPALNPLPPLALPAELFAPPAPPAPRALDAAFILSANNARRSVIVSGPPAPPAPPARRPEYVHKIRRAACGVALPPIDAAKFAELARHTELAPARPPKDDAIFKKILCDDERDPPPAAAAPAPAASPAPAQQLHWRKLKLNNTW